MAIWQVNGKDFDDGADQAPGEEGFSDVAVKAKAAGKGYTYLGRSPGYVRPQLLEVQEEEPADKNAD